jgi:flagellar M-ring protein FliF
VVGYEIFDKADALGTSNFVLNLNQLRALEGELSRTLTGFDTIEAARVHLVMPKRELFSRDGAEPTASVALKLRGAGGLSKSEIGAVQHLVATAVPGLKPQRVTIVDNRGVLLAKGVSEEEDANLMSEEAEEYRVTYEKRLSGTIQDLLEQSLGIGKVKAEVHAEIDFDRIVTNQEKYDPEGQVARSIQSVTENEKASEAAGDGAVSVANQLPGGAAGGGSAGQNQQDKTRSEETTNYEISKQVTNSVRETGNVKRLSVAVLVDGTYTGEGADAKYAPRPEEEIKKLQQLVQSVIGYDEKRGDKIEVINMQFAAAPNDLFDTSPMDWLKADLSSIIQTLVLGGVSILAILFVIRPMVTRGIESLESANKDDELEQAALAAPGIAARLTDQSTRALKMEEEPDEIEDMINIDRIQGKVKSSSYKKMNNLVDKHADETAQILRQWLSVNAN